MTLNEAVIEIKALFVSGRYAECEHLCTQILQVQKTNAAALYLIGRIGELNGDRIRAAEHYYLAAQIFPHNEEFKIAALRNADSNQLVPWSDQIERSRSTIANFPNKPALRIVNNPLGTFAVPLYPDNDVITQSIVAGSVFEPEIVDVARDYIVPGTVAIDVGANFGQMSLIFAKIVGPEGHVYALEADSYVHHILETNIRLNQIGNVTAIPKAAHKKAGELVFFPDQDFVQFQTYGSYGIDMKASSGRQVETITIDKLNISRPVSFMKIDVQGCDLFAMIGAVETINKYRMPIVFEYEEQFQDDFGTSFEDYVNFVKDIDYKFIKTVKNINYLIAPR